MELNSPRFEYCLLYLLELFPVNIQSQLRAVCSLWKSLIEQRVWSKVKKIDINFYDDDDDYLITFDYCILQAWNVNSTLEQFVTNENFPGVTSLGLNFAYDNKPSSKSLVSHCLTQWTSTLIDLNLFIIIEHDDESSQSTMWKQIDSMKSLKSFEFRLNDLTRDWKVPDNLSILANLEMLLLSDIGNDQKFALNQIGPNLKRFIFEDPKPESIQLLNSIVPKWISLRELEIHIEQYSKPYLLDHLTALAQLNQLAKLKLCNVDWDQFNSLITPSLSRDYPKLISVKHLEIELLNANQPSNPRLHIDQINRFFFACMPIMFPSLEILLVDMYGPDDQQFLNMVQDKMKRKFVALVQGQFVLRAYR